MKTKNNCVILRIPNIPKELKIKIQQAALKRNIHLYQWAEEAFEEKLENEKN